MSEEKGGRGKKEKKGEDRSTCQWGEGVGRVRKRRRIPKGQHMSMRGNKGERARERWEGEREGGRKKEGRGKEGGGEIEKQRRKGTL